MSWFDAAGLANIAKSALKGAQRTIDKALDIKDESNSPVTNNSQDKASGDLYDDWGVKQSEQSKTIKESSSLDDIHKMKTSVWGSFTGSFFDISEDNTKTHFDSLGLDDIDSRTEHFKDSKLIVQGDDEIISVNGAERKHSVEIDVTSSNTEKKNIPDGLETTEILSEISNKPLENVVLITDSIECIEMSPDSEALSLGQSVSTSSSVLGTKLTSDSLEILGDSITSPSSVEVIGTDSTNSRRQSQHTNEFISPLNSPFSDNISSSIEKISPSSVEIIPEDLDDNSIAEDTMSYTSVSESTSVTVLDSAFNLHLKPQKMLKDTFSRSDAVMENSISDVTSSPNKNYSDAITVAPSRIGMHLALTQVNQMYMDSQHQNNKDDLSKILQKTNVIDIPADNMVSSSETQLDMSTDEGSQSDKTVVANDNIIESSSDASTTTETSSHSTYLKTMLADAMTEKYEEPSGSSIHLSDNMSIITRENSPNSSESRSDLVKIGSDYTSGHTSGDELETTSSDIEIISSPNGDSSSTQSRQSPAKQTCIKHRHEESTTDSLLYKVAMKRTKGHNRELSEASSISDDSHSLEVSRLLRRISEMAEILELRETKLIDVNQRNAELQEVNNDLKLQLNSVITKQLESADLSQVTEEYTQRMSALEKKFQQAIREKDILRKQLEQAKQEADTKISKVEADTLLFEKDEVIKELREEGEKLSKQQLQHCNIIKKLRSKEKENESVMKNLNERIEALTLESERLKKSLTAKEDVERSQIEAIHKLTSNNKKLENKVIKLESDLDDFTQKYEATKSCLDAAKKELLEKNVTSSNLLAREQMVETLENQYKIAEKHNEEMSNQLEDLRYQLQQSEEKHVKKEQKLREINNKLLKRLEEIEARDEELSHSIIETSKPLIRQLETLQATHSMKVAAFDKMEEELTMKIRELTVKLQTASCAESKAKEECMTMKTKLLSVEDELSTVNRKVDMLQMQLEQQKTEKELSEQELKRKVNALDDIIKSNKELIRNQEEQISTLQQKLTLVKPSNEEIKPAVSILQSPNKDENHQHQQFGEDLASRSNSNSPTLSLGKVSNYDASSFWSQDDSFDLGHTPRYTNMFEMQMLQTNLKQREGEVQQLQWELNRREQERSLLNSEISLLLTKTENFEQKLSEFSELKRQFSELQQQYDTLCQLYGEKVEENEELKLDLQDVKDMYKSQIDDLLKQQKRNIK